MRSLQLLVERSVVERYRVEVADDFDETDPMALQELFAEGPNRPEPYESRDDDFHVTVERDVTI
jgi:hypothetical protein